MKKLFKWFLRLLVIAVLLIGVCVLFLDQIARAVALRQIREQTGLGVTIGRVSIGLRSPTLAIENLKLSNSPEFGGSVFLDVPELRVYYDLQALRTKKIHLNAVRFNLAELHIVQNKEGKTNLQALQERQKHKGSGSGSGEPAVEFQSIDTLNLAIGRLKFTSEKNRARNEEAYVGYKNETVKNVKSMKDLEPLIARLRLEKDVKFLSNELFKPDTNALPNSTQPNGKEGLKTLGAAAEPLKQP